VNEQEADYLIEPPKPGAKRVPPEDRLAEIVRQAEENDHLRHLYGKPLDLGDDDPNWFIARELKNAGFSHPLIERGKPVDEMLEAAQKIVDRLRRQRRRLASSESGCTAQDADAFNRSRGYEIEAYRRELQKANRAIRDYNLGAPDVLHRRPLNVEREVSAIEAEIPPLAILSPPPEPPRQPSRLLRVLRRLRGQSPSLDHMSPP
jgi:hypothetical protein